MASTRTSDTSHVQGSGRTMGVPMVSVYVEVQGSGWLVGVQWDQVPLRLLVIKYKKIDKTK